MSVPLIYDDIKDELQSEQTDGGKELETKRPEETTDKRMSRQTDRQTEGEGRQPNRLRDGALKCENSLNAHKLFIEGTWHIHQRGG